MEAALSIYLENFATTLGSREQLAIAEFADALLTIPKTLAVNAAQVRLDDEPHDCTYALEPASCVIRLACMSAMMRRLSLTLHDAGIV